MGKVKQEATSHTLKITRKETTQYSGIFYDYVVDGGDEQRYISERKTMEVLRDLVRDGVPVSVIHKVHATVETPTGARMQSWGGAVVKK